MIDEPLLYADMLELARQHTKWAWEARHASEIPNVMSRAVRIAQSPPTGPVFISLPVDAMEERAEIELLPRTEIGSRIRGDIMEIEKAAALLAQARNPAIIAGDGCARSGALFQVALRGAVVSERETDGGAARRRRCDFNHRREQSRAARLQWRATDSRERAIDSGKRGRARTWKELSGRGGDTGRPAHGY